MTKRTTINYMLLGGGGSPEKNTFLILAKHQREHVRVTMECGVG